MCLRGRGGEGLLHLRRYPERRSLQEAVWYTRKRTPASPRSQYDMAAISLRIASGSSPKTVQLCAERPRTFPEACRNSARPRDSPTDKQTDGHLRLNWVRNRARAETILAFVLFNRPFRVTNHLHDGPKSRQKKVLNRARHDVVSCWVPRNPHDLTHCGERLQHSAECNKVCVSVAAPRPPHRAGPGVAGSNAHLHAKRGSHTQHGRLHVSAWGEHWSCTVPKSEASFAPPSTITPPPMMALLNRQAGASSPSAPRRVHTAVGSCTPGNRPSYIYICIHADKSVP